ncbi:hypothetical protein, partial [Bartonella bovis]|uniref:hypothetical protein n=1 Tax=Bartonella bovis TaxID=155194 RepID=UPI0011AF0976
MAGLALTSHTKAYADQNCGSGSSVATVNNVVGPIVCDGGGTKTLNSSGGSEIKIDMDRHSREEAAVTVTGPGTNITIIAKKLTVTGSKGSGLPVIKVEKGGKLTYVSEATGMIKKEIVVDGSESSVTLKGVLKGFDGVKINDGGVVVLGEKVTGIEEVKVGINNGGMVTLMKDVAFNNGTEAGIKIEGSGKASVIGVGRTMTVKGTRGGIEVEAGAGKIDATVMGLTIKGGSGGMGVSMQGTGTMELNKVNVSGFTMGVNAKNGTVKLMGESTITVANSGTGIMVSGNGATVSMTQGKIEGGGGSG